MLLITGMGIFDMNSKEILLAHGSGGKASCQLIDKYLLPGLDNAFIRQMDDSVRLPVDGGTILFTTDSYVVDPPFFPGGDIGMLAVNGTVNDLSVCGGKPLYLSLSLILEEGFPLEHFEAVIKSVSESAKEAGVKVVTGDTKVVGRGSVDKIFINTAGIGSLNPEVCFSPGRISPGDAVILSGTIGDHGIAVMLEREGLDMKSDIISDTAPLNKMVSKMMSEADSVRFMRDPTRGGVATTLNEISSRAGLGILVREESVPVNPGVAAASEILGLDPLYIANEGKLIAIVDRNRSDKILDIIREDRYGREAAIIGHVTRDFPGKVVLKTKTGGRRMLEMLTGDQLPRIC